MLEDEKIVYTELHRRSPEMRNYSLNQLVSMMEMAGYEKVRAVPEYYNNPASDEDGTFRIFGERA